MASRALSSSFPRYSKTLLSRLRVDPGSEELSRRKQGRKKGEAGTYPNVNENQLPVAVSS